MTRRSQKPSSAAPDGDVRPPTEALGWLVPVAYAQFRWKCGYTCQPVRVWYASGPQRVGHRAELSTTFGLGLNKRTPQTRNHIPYGWMYKRLDFNKRNSE